MSNYFGNSGYQPQPQQPPPPNTNNASKDPYAYDYNNNTNNNNTNNTNYNSYTATNPTHNNSSTQQQNQPMNQNQAAGGTTPFWNPAMASTFASVATSAAASAALNGTSQNPNAMLDLGLKAGHTFLDQGTARMIPGLEKLMRQLRGYFAVNNKYVKRKMMRVLFSFCYRDWQRLTVDSNHTSPDGGLAYAPPINDDNALDLYLPLMSLITYVLLCGLCYGTSGQFDPEVLPDVTTRCILIQIVEVLLFRLGFYMMQSSANAGVANKSSAAGLTFMDLFAITGYKYLGLTLNMFVGYSLSLALVSGGQKGYYGTFLWTATAASYFMLKFMANNIPESIGNDGTGKGPKKEFMVLAFAGSQFASMWFLGQTKFLN